MQKYQQWDEVRKYFHKNPDVNVSEYYNDKYALWLDFRTTDDNKLHGSGRRIENASEGITIRMTSDIETPGELMMCRFLVLDAQLNIDGGRLY